MPTPKAEEIKISSELKEIFKTIASCTKHSNRLIRRVKIILEAANGVANIIIGKKWDLSRSQVRYWQKKNGAKL